MLVKGNSPAVRSNQTGPHGGIDAAVSRHLKTVFRKTCSGHNVKLFEAVNAIRKSCDKPIILDSGCGDGNSTMELARQFRDTLVIGIDKSDHRLSRLCGSEQLLHRDNLVIARANLIDFWRLAGAADWKLERHYLFYPNPWPLKKHLGKRWHCHPVFNSVLSLGGRLELRCNWKHYATEFAYAVQHATGRTGVVDSFLAVNPVSPFERKYSRSGHPLYRYVIDLSGQRSP